MKEVRENPTDISRPTPRTDHWLRNDGVKFRSVRANLQAIVLQHTKV